MYINNPGHMTKMAAMPIYGKNPSKISGTGGPISTKLGMKHQWIKYYNVYMLQPICEISLFMKCLKNFSLFVKSLIHSAIS